MSDRLKAAWRAAQGIDPLVPYRCIYRAKVIGQSGDLQKVSVKPFDPSVPPMADIPLRHGVPGIKVQVQPGCTVQVGWDDGRPDRPFAALWSAETSAMRIVMPVTSRLELGMDGATEKAVLGDLQKSALVAFSSALQTYAAAIKTTADPSGLATAALGVAVTLFQTQLELALSQHVKVGP